MKLNILLLATFSALSLQSIAQTEPCASDWLHKKEMLANPEYREAFQVNREAARSFNEGREDLVYHIPVVVHVIHRGEPVGTGSNISDEQIHSAISSLNKAFRKEGITGNGVDTGIDFCLAEKSPTGAAHTGINRVSAAEIGDYGTNGITYGGISNNEKAIKALSRWDNKKYYNLWVVAEIENNNAGSGVQGFAYFPGAPGTVDGAVMLYNAFGYDPQGNYGFNLKSYTRMNGTLIHEMGHGLNLYHSFEGDGSGTSCPTEVSCGNDGDEVCDTPPHKRSNSSCVPGVANSCGDGTSDAYIHNYMDYSSDACKNEFTHGQRNRMRSALVYSRPLLATSTACSGMPPIITSTDEESPSMKPVIKTTVNPTITSGEIIVTSKNEPESDTKILVYSITGTMVRSINMKGTKMSIDLSGVNSGMYFVRIEERNKAILTTKINKL